MGSQLYISQYRWPYTIATLLRAAVSEPCSAYIESDAAVGAVCSDVWLWGLRFPATETEGGVHPCSPASGGMVLIGF
ncbi:hypothetical protein RHGRI_020819 [Rhododendron griersonianum]|uniref:Secreted protein n=1 Tax=Rhododendron griersonianum TaxID=479676 RepID=A0AAV6JJN9_9ERIC|nr:hypothetical protein RHGRI_020819 [Rhododendron griersonianum]